jgi:acetone carboxylase gamma subunit
MRRRGIDTSVVHRVLAAPEQRHRVRAHRDVLQSRIAFGDKIYLVRVFVDLDRRPPDVVTVYRTTNIAKYWRAKT